jgi:acetyltransferase-like isoleucine patch superfamily enzyme
MNSSVKIFSSIINGINKKASRLARKILPATMFTRLYTKVKRAKLSVGSNTFIHRSVHIIGRSSVVIGSNTSIGEDTWINVNHSAVNSISIGNNCFIGRRNFFTSGKSISIGDYCLTTIDCKFIGSSHIATDPLQPYLTTGTTNSDAIIVGCNVFIAAGVTILGNVSIGCGSILGTGAFINKDIPSFSLVIGNPSRIIKRYSFLKKQWIHLDNLAPDDLADNPTEPAYLAMLRSTHPNIQLPILAAGSDMGSL